MVDGITISATNSGPIRRIKGGREMNGSDQHSGIFLKLRFVFAILIAFLTNAAYAETHVVNPGSGPDLYVSWSGAGNPVEGTHFTTDFSDEANPNVELKTGNVTWNVRSQNGSNPGSIGAVSINPVSSTADFGLTIKNGSNPGAANVGSIVLSHTGWTGNSSISGGEITGNLTGNLTVIKDSNDDGGIVDGLTIDGDIGSSSTITASTVSELSIDGDLDGDILVGDAIDGQLFVNGNV
jgi:hypothetical protein